MIQQDKLEVHSTPAGTVEELCARWDTYRAARRDLHRYLGLTISNRDPLSEFAEHYVAALLDGKLAKNRVQPDWDLVDASGDRVQVRYVANTKQNHWVNGHDVTFPNGCDKYALVIFDALEISTVCIFSRAGMHSLYEKLNKTHSGKGHRLSITLGNVRRFEREPELFEALGLATYVVRDRSRHRF